MHTAGHGQKCVDRGEQRRADAADEHRHEQTAGSDQRNERRDCAEEHHAVKSEVQNAGALVHDLAQRRQEQRRALRDGSGQSGTNDDLNHGRASFPSARSCNL